jgi:hypothetical protein
MAVSIELERLEETLRSASNYRIIEDLHYDREKCLRTFGFSINGDFYKIEWWANISYLCFNDITVPFHSIEFSGTWPNKFKTNLQLKYHGETSFILGIEKMEVFD